ncbi:MAG TPA: dihydrodipicolinate synthase family protein [Spirochaetales bacterium]|nr:dihydrodipicolinate synthase family protein [Spirochaetales bacterium]HOV38461.1 dihydrodipicolinate synthase family protein [Spirochaetales bacterium]
MTRIFSGIIPPVITCFDKNGKFDPVRQREIMHFLSPHVQGFYPCGTYGSGPLMQVEERKKVAEAVIKEKGSTFVIVHVGAASTEEVVELAKHAESAGADAVGAIPPYYYKYSQEALIDHYRALLRAVHIPVFLYNNPEVSGNPIAPESLKILADEGLAGVKDSSFDLVNLYLYMNKVKKPGFQFIVGTEAIAQPALDAGAVGVIAGLANIFPELLADFYKTWKAGDSRAAAKKQLKIVEARAVMKLGPTLTMTYAVLRMRGMDPGFPRAPYKEINRELYTRAEKEMKALGLL